MRLMLLGAILATTLCACAARGTTCPEGWAQLEKRDYPAALALFERALVSADSAELHAGKARALSAMGGSRSAADAFEAALRREPLNADWHLGRGVVYLTTGDPVSAIAAFDEALSLDPESAKAHFNRGLAYQRIQDPSRALSEFSAAIRLDPKLSRAYEGRGVCLALGGRFDSALENFREALRLDPLLASARANSAAANYALGESQLAFVDLNTAIRINAKNPLFYLSRGRIYLDLSDAQRATRDFEQALSLSPTDAQAWLLLSRAQQQSGQPEASLESEARAFSLAPELENDER